MEFNKPEFLEELGIRIAKSTEWNDLIPLAESTNPAIEFLVSEARALDEDSDSEEVATSLFRDIYPTLRMISGSWSSIRSPHDAGPHEEISTVEDEAALVRSLCLSVNQTLSRHKQIPTLRRFKTRTSLIGSSKSWKLRGRKYKSSNVGTVSCILETGSPILTVFHVPPPNTSVLNEVSVTEAGALIGQAVANIEELNDLDIRRDCYHCICITAQKTKIHVSVLDIPPSKIRGLVGKSPTEQETRPSFINMTSSPHYDIQHPESRATVLRLIAGVYLHLEKLLIETSTPCPQDLSPEPARDLGCVQGNET